MATKHALLSASSSHRWLNCTAAPHYELQFPDKETNYAAEGTLAHKFCEEIANYNFHVITKRTFNSRWKKLQDDPLYQEEMLQTAEFYAHYLWEKYLSFESKPFTAQEVSVDLTDWIPEGLGTCDSVMIGSGRLHITDYKHGKGVPVSSMGNPQMRLYALGALKKYSPIFGNSIQKVSMAIVQPRITEDVSEEQLTVDELLAWGDSIKPVAQKAYAGEGEFSAGDWCRFCKGKAVCRARSENATALEDFKNIPIQGRLTETEKTEFSKQQLITGKTSVLTNAEVADLIRRGETLVSWYEDLKSYALEAILNGHEIPGFKAVAGKSNRTFADLEKALETIKNAGYDEALLYERKAKTLTQLETLVGGKKAFAELLGEQIIKPIGKPTLAEASDKRPDYNEAAKDFAGVVNG